MPSFEIQWRASIKKDLRKIPRQEVAKIIDAVAQLAQNPIPHGSEKIVGAERTYRIRIGDYRVVYDVRSERKIVDILRVRHRKDVYR